MVCPAGVPVALPKGTTVSFVWDNEYNLPKGVLRTFTTDSIYYAMFYKRLFTGYKTNPGKRAYDKFVEIDNTSEVKVIVPGKLGFQAACEYMNFTYTYKNPPINSTGKGEFVNKLNLEEGNILTNSAFYSTCLPKISYDRYNERVFGYYNHYNRKGFLSAVINAEGTLSYVYSGPFGENGEIIYLQYNESNGIWKPFNAPTPDCLSCDINKMIGILYSSELGHLVLDVAGMVPVFGEAFDVLNGVWYTIEGDGDMAIISFASTIPLVYATTIKNVGRIIKLSDGTFAAIKLNAEASEILITSLKNAKLSDDALKALLKDLQIPTFAKALAENPRLVDAWAAVNHLPDAIKLEPTVLSKLNDITSRGRGIDLPKLETALKGDLGEVLGKATGDDLTKILNRLDADHVTGSHLDEITSRLGNAEYGIKQDLIDNPHWFETFDDVLQEPGRYWDILVEGNITSGSPLAKWGQGKWWKNLREFADNFESGAARSRFQTDLNLADNKIVNQVTLKVNGTKIRVDYIGLDANGKFHLGDAKFSTKDKNWSSSWLDASTPNQSTVYPLFESGNVNSIVVKVSDPEKAVLLQRNLGLVNGGTIDFTNTSLKILGSDAGQTTVKSVITIKN